jgi:hypothetical protein
MGGKANGGCEGEEGNGREQAAAALGWPCSQSSVTQYCQCVYPVYCEGHMSQYSGWLGGNTWCSSSDLAAVARTRATGKNEGETRGWETVIPASTVRTVPHTPTRVP